MNYLSVIVGSFVSVCLVVSDAYGGDTDGEGAISSQPSASIGYGGATALASTLARADEAALRSTIRPAILKGGFGEAHMSRHLTKYLRHTGDWMPMPTRLGPQGIDGLFIRYDSNGSPSGLIVSEAKFGSSRLNMTGDGIQMGLNWRSARLARLAAEYRSIADAIRSNSMAIADSTGSVGRQRFQIPLADGKKVAVFARPRSGQPWVFVGPRELMEQAGRQARIVSNYLQLASEGKIAYESSVYRIGLKAGSMQVTIKDAFSLGQIANEADLPVRRSISIPLQGGRLEQLRSLGRVEIARLIRQKYPAIPPSEIDLHARGIVRSTRNFETLFSSRPRSLASTVTQNSIKFGGALAIIDVTIRVLGDYRRNGQVDWRRAGLSGGITLVGSSAGFGVGQGVTIVVTKNPILHQFVSHSSPMLGIGSTSLARNALGGMAGGSVASVFMAYGGYFAGLHDLTTANRFAIAGGSSAMAGAAFGFGMVTFASTIGTASTGTAIASLSGAAATNASLAWLGGGALSSGGFGMAGGTIVVTGGIALVAIGTGAAVYAAFSYSDRKQDLERIRMTMNELKSRPAFSRIGAGSQRFNSITIGH